MSKDGLVGVNSKCGIQSKRRCETAMNLAFVLLDWETDLTDNQVIQSRHNSVVKLCRGADRIMTVSSRFSPYLCPFIKIFFGTVSVSYLFSTRTLCDFNFGALNGP